MPNYFTLTLDTIGPANPSLVINSNSQYATSNMVTAAISTSDGTTTGYQMKVWGDLDLAWAKAQGVVSSGATTVDEASALWISYSTSKQLQLSSGDGNKAVSLQIRDDVLNPSATVSDSISLDSTRPAVTITGPDKSKISKRAGANQSNFSFTVDSNFVEYKVKVVNSQGATHDTGTLIPTTSGSSNMAGTGSWTSSSVIDATITGSDLEAASSGDSQKIIKVFVRDSAGNWSI